jgi:hypothetical protein
MTKIGRGFGGYLLREPRPVTKQDNTRSAKTRAMLPALAQPFGF